jgi:hypothetical protein
MLVEYGARLGEMHQTFWFLRPFELYRHVYEGYPKVSGLAPGARTANGTALCHEVQLYRYVVSQSSQFCRHNPLYCFSTSVCCCKLIFRYRLSPKTF